MGGYHAVPFVPAPSAFSSARWPTNLGSFKPIVPMRDARETVVGEPENPVIASRASEICGMRVSKKRVIALMAWKIVPLKGLDPVARLTSPRFEARH